MKIRRTPSGDVVRLSLTLDASTAARLEEEKAVSGRPKRSLVNEALVRFLDLRRRNREAVKARKGTWAENDWSPSS